MGDVGDVFPPRPECFRRVSDDVRDGRHRIGLMLRCHLKGEHVPYVHHLARVLPGHHWDAFRPPAERGAVNAESVPPIPKKHPFAIRFGGLGAWFPNL